MVKKRRVLGMRWTTAKSKFSIDSVRLTEEERTERDKNPIEYDANLKAGERMYDGN